MAPTTVPTTQEATTMEGGVVDTIEGIANVADNLVRLRCNIA